MKKILMLAVAAIFFTSSLCGVSCKTNERIYYSEYGMPSEDDIIFKKLDGGNIEHDGAEYELVKNDGTGNYDSFGVEKRIGNIEGNENIGTTGRLKYMIGLYSLKNDIDLNILLYIAPKSETLSFFRKKGSAELDFTLEKSIRMEYIKVEKLIESTMAPDPKHAYCDEGIKGEELEEFKLYVNDAQGITVSDKYKTSGYLYGFIPGCSYMAMKMEVLQYDGNYALKLSGSKLVQLDSAWVEKLTGGK